MPRSLVLLSLLALAGCASWSGGPSSTAPLEPSLEGRELVAAGDVGDDESFRIFRDAKGDLLLEGHRKSQGTHYDFWLQVDSLFTPLKGGVSLSDAPEESGGSRQPRCRQEFAVDSGRVRVHYREDGRERFRGVVETPRAFAVHFGSRTDLAWRAFARETSGRVSYLDLTSCLASVGVVGLEEGALRFRDPSSSPEPFVEREADEFVGIEWTGEDGVSDTVVAFTVYGVPVRGETDAPFILRRLWTRAPSLPDLMP